MSVRHIDSARPHMALAVVCSKCSASHVAVCQPDTTFPLECRSCGEMACVAERDPAMRHAAMLLLAVEREMRRAMALHPAPMGFGPALGSLFARQLDPIEADARKRQDEGYGTRSDVLVEEVCEMHRACPGTPAYEAECVQVAASALRNALLSMALREGAR